MKFLFVLCVFVIFSSSITFCEVKQAKVVRIIDGDTVVLDVSGASTTVRLAGIDAPELKRSLRLYKQANELGLTHIKTREFGVISRATLAEFIPTGSFCLFEKNGARDKYGRTVGYIYDYEGGDMINFQMVAIGYAFVYPNGSKKGDRVIHDMIKAQAIAKEFGVGMWEK